MTAQQEQNAFLLKTAGAVHEFPLPPDRLFLMAIAIMPDCAFIGESRYIRRRVSIDLRLPQPWGRSFKVPPLGVYSRETCRNNGGLQAYKGNRPLNWESLTSKP